MNNNFLIPTNIKYIHKPLKSLSHTNSMDLASRSKPQSLKVSLQREQYQFLYSQQVQLSNYSSLTSYYQLSHLIASQQSGNADTYNKQNLVSQQPHHHKNTTRNMSFIGFRNSQWEKSQQIKKPQLKNYYSSKNIKLEEKFQSKPCLYSKGYYQEKQSANQAQQEQCQNLQKNQSQEASSSISNNHYQKSLISSSFIELPSPNKLQKRVSKYFHQGCTQCLLM